MSQNNYEENLFGAIDLIVTERLRGLQYDTTMICTITNADNAHNGKYMVTDGSAHFAAYSERYDYKVDDMVRVQVPNNNTTEKMYIIGKYVVDNNMNPITYVSPLESILDITNNILDTTVANSTYGAIANSVRELSDTYEMRRFGRLISTVDVSQYSSINENLFDVFYIAAEFKTLLNDYDITQGNYGIRADFYNGEKIKSVYLDSSDMFGDPYRFAIYTSQQQTYDIRELGQIDKISFYIYQDNNFKHNTDGPNEWLLYSEEEKETLDFNILVKNLKVGFGSHLSNVEDNTVKIYTNNELTFNKEDESSKRKSFRLLWYNKDENGKYLGYSDGNWSNEIAYRAAAQEIQKLNDQLSDNNVPHDCRGVAIAANFKELQKIYPKIVNLFEDNFIPAWVRYEKDIGATENLFSDSLSGWISLYKDDIAKVEEYYTQMFAAAASMVNETSVLNGFEVKPEFPSLDTKATAEALSTDLETEYNIIAQQLAALSVEASYTGVKDAFVATINGYLATLSDLKTAIGTNLLVFTIPGTETAQWLGAGLEEYRTEDYEINLYVEQSLSEERDNAYAIYWYRYDPNNFLGDTYPQDDFVPLGWKRLNDATDYQRTNFSVTLDADNFTQEKIVAVLFYNHQQYNSNAITFVNDSEVIGQGIEQLSDYITIEHGENSESSYQKYGEANYLINGRDSEVVRTISVQYNKNNTTVDNSLLQNSQIYWYLPNNSTMLQPSEDYDDFVEITDNLTSKYVKKGYTCYYRQNSPDNVINTFTYCIDKYYIDAFTKNKILCKVVTSYGKEYDTEIDFTFSSYGTSGTDYTLRITPIGRQTAVMSGGALSLGIKLYDYNNRLQPITLSRSNISIIGNNYDYDLPEDSTVISVFKTSESNYYGVVKVTYPIDGVNLTAYYPLAYATGNYFIEGTTTIVYDNTGGNPQYFKDPYVLYSYAADGAEVSTDGWTIGDERATDISNLDLSLMPTINNNILKPSVMYVDGYEPQLVASAAGYYYQSVYICQNRYPSAMLNSWDNNLTIDENNGIILSTVVGAGRKDLNNLFNGVLMGEIESNIVGNHSGYGLYGFNAGAQSFGFNVDGTAFIGKSNRGRIYFDGNSGIIQSASYTLNNATGMKIDLDDGYIHIKGADRTDDIYSARGDEIYLGVTRDPYFYINSVNGNRLINIGVENYYLQTDNFADKYTEGNEDIFVSADADTPVSVRSDGYDVSASNFTGAGTRIDLKNGNITSYDFTIDAYSGNNNILFSSSADEYPFIINDGVFKVSWAGEMISKAGVIGDSVATGQLFISGNQNFTTTTTTEAGDSSTSTSTSIVYFQKGDDKTLNLSKIQFGNGDNDFYLGSGGLIMKDPDGTSEGFGARLTAHGLLVDGTGYTDWKTWDDNIQGLASAFYQGHGLMIQVGTEATSTLFSTSPKSWKQKMFFGFSSPDSPMIAISQTNQFTIQVIDCNFRFKRTGTREGSLLLDKGVDIHRYTNTDDESDEIDTDGIFQKVDRIIKQIADIYNRINDLKDKDNDLEADINALSTQLSTLLLKKSGSIETID